MEKHSIETLEELVIPEHLIYEVMDGKPIYYKGYQEVLKGTQNPEDIMGCSDVQGLVIRSILKYLFKFVDGEAYSVVTNEIGLHLDTRNNLSADIAIFDKQRLRRANKKNQYFDLNPEVVIEVDIQGSVEGSVYYHTKTQKLLDFGVKEVIWIFTENKKVSYAAAGEEHWLTFPWDQPFSLLNDFRLNVKEQVTSDGLM